ncbi:tyrosine-type recombinase/integrase [Pseudonocardia sp. WMMC193]|uniref:tyrosine-type recombinase/integrase n=1 Tax=Pseudonocardia sp. WMMC193 TaxID=2911965 RepID=UPI001F009FAD|nr:tyrosine-type recombinase/integrase [Pseudonocardia sp. WMMC193]MCF7549313.1 tyrosine-type recombinase/integrase [Pseudonocardia sp. WMMC193]
MLREHRERVAERLRTLGTTLTDQTFAFGLKTPDHSQPYSPNAVTQRCKRMAERAGIDTHIHNLCHYSATELLTAGVDLRTVAGRLGHGAGGATTLEVYAAWVAASDRKAAEVAAARMPRWDDLRGARTCLHTASSPRLVQRPFGCSGARYVET